MTRLLLFFAAACLGACQLVANQDDLVWPDAADAGWNGELTAPTGLAPQSGVSFISLSWNTVQGAEGYAVHRATAEAGPFQQIAAPVAASYVDEDVAGDGAYFYKVQATLSSGATGPFSAVVRAMRSIAAPTELTAQASPNQVLVSWEPIAEPGAEYQLEVAGSAEVLVPWGQATDHLADGLTNGTSYCFVVRARKGERVSAPSESVCARPYRELCFTDGMANQIRGVDASPGGGSVVRTYASRARLNSPKGLFVRDGLVYSSAIAGWVTAHRITDEGDAPPAQLIKVPKPFHIAVDDDGRLFTAFRSELRVYAAGETAPAAPQVAWSSPTYVVGLALREAGSATELFVAQRFNATNAAQVESWLVGAAGVSGPTITNAQSLGLASVGPMALAGDRLFVLDPGHCRVGSLTLSSREAGAPLAVPGCTEGTELRGLESDPARNELFVLTPNAITVLDISTGELKRKVDLQQLDEALIFAYDSANHLAVVNDGDNRLLVFDVSVGGSQNPLRSIGGGADVGPFPTTLRRSEANGELVVTGSRHVAVFTRAGLAVAPVRRISYGWRRTVDSAVTDGGALFVCTDTGAFLERYSSTSGAQPEQSMQPYYGCDRGMIADGNELFTPSTGSQELNVFDLNTFAREPKRTVTTVVKDVALFGTGSEAVLIVAGKDEVKAFHRLANGATTPMWTLVAPGVWRVAVDPTVPELFVLVMKQDTLHVEVYGLESPPSSPKRTFVSPVQADEANYVLPPDMAFCD